MEILRGYTKRCPKCHWKPNTEEHSAIFSDLIDHAMTAHRLPSPTFGEKPVLLTTGPPADFCEAAWFLEF
jgi:hypothetical protein